MKKIALLVALIGSMHATRKAVIKSSVANLRNKKTSSRVISNSPEYKQYDPDQESQLLFGEQCLVHKVDGKWAYISTPEQPKNEYEDLHGLIKVKHLECVDDFLPTDLIVKSPSTIYKKDGITPITKVSLGTKLSSEDETVNEWIIKLPQENGVIKKSDVVSLRGLRDENQKRDTVVEIAKLFLNQPYTWGGRSFFDPTSTSLTGVDCSGLISLCYRFINKNIPRDSNPQFLNSEVVESGSELKPGDLIFLRRKTNKNVSHVMMYIGNNKVIHSIALCKNCVLISDITEELGSHVSDINNGDIKNGFTSLIGKECYGDKPIEYFMFFGRYI